MDETPQIDALDRAALAHYTALIEALYPGHLALALATARYEHALAQASVALPVLRETLSAVGESRPDLRRDIGRTVAALDRAGEGRPSGKRA